MDAATALNALKSGDVTAFVAAVEWDESEWIDVPSGVVPDGMGNPFIGRFGAVTVGIEDHGQGRYEVRLHSHTEGVQEATECYGRQASEIHAVLALHNAVHGTGLTGMYL